MTHDVIVVGGGPAGLSAAQNVRARGRTVLVVSNPLEENPLWKAERVDNYLGLPAVSGAELLTAFRRHGEAAGADFQEGRVLSALRSGEDWYVSIGNTMAQAKAVVLAAGVARGRKFPGEAELLGRGVSYCATCDGMLYRGRDTVVAGEGGEAVEDANFLHGIGCRVQFFARGERPGGLREEIPFHSAKRFRVVGENGRATGLEADGTFYPAYAVFVLRPTVSIESLLHGLKTEDGRIVTDRDMTTSIPGVFAAGDCAGKPLQLAKAVGEGNIAALSADRWLNEKGGKND